MSIYYYDDEDDYDNDDDNDHDDVPIYVLRVCVVIFVKEGCHKVLLLVEKYVLIICWKM